MEFSAYPFDTHQCHNLVCEMILLKDRGYDDLLKVLSTSNDALEQQLPVGNIISSYPRL